MDDEKELYPYTKESKCSIVIMEGIPMACKEMPVLYR